MEQLLLAGAFWIRYKEFDVVDDDVPGRAILEETARPPSS